MISGSAHLRHRRSTVWSLILLAFGVLAAAVASPAHAAKETTWIVLDAATGQVLSQHDPDGLNYPASLTKMMTLFLTFQALEQGRITLDTRFEVSRHASVQQPSKLGLVPGSTIAVHDLILAVVTHSANDAAVVLAEGLAGSESAFAVRMNAEARALGMTRTNFRNASGLPDRFQYTTARDLSKLALALYRSFPREYRYFATEEFTYNGHSYGNHNHLMEAFQGMDGIKTGFINASGFNLAASAVRNNRRLVGVIMGGRTAQSRDMEMAELLDDAFAHRGTAAEAVASNEPADHGLRNGDGLSQIAASAARTPDEPAATPRHERQHRVAYGSHRHIRRDMRVGMHHHLRRGVELASAEETIPPRASPAHHRRGHASSGWHRSHPEHKLVGHKHHQHLAGNHRAGHRHYAGPHHGNTVVRSANAGKSIQHGRGYACGGWNGNNRPCPPQLRGSVRREASRGPMDRFGISG